uniref:Uncharacterized protein n=1 Tax=Strigops habroptila TaxID=2489341 RepID=A0A672TUK3_STRHB
SSTSCISFLFFLPGKKEYTHTHTHTHTHMYTYIYTHTYESIHIHIYVYTQRYRLRGLICVYCYLNTCINVARLKTRQKEKQDCLFRDTVV